MEVNQIQIKKILCLKYWGMLTLLSFFLNITFCLLSFLFWGNIHEWSWNYSHALFVCIVHMYCSQMMEKFDSSQSQTRSFCSPRKHFFVGSKIIDPPIIFRPTNIKNNKNKNKNKNLQLILEVREINSQVFNTLN